MEITTIGKEIAALRKEMGLKQEDVAKQVGVSPQAVSKWENGSMPDTELLPKIADVFGVSIDRLFGRNTEKYQNLKEVLTEKLAKLPIEERFREAFAYCWALETGVFGTASKETVEDMQKNIGDNQQIYSSVLRDEGFTRMGIGNRLQYFLLVPEIEDKNSALFEGIDYVAFFKDFSEKAVFDACVFLNKRNHEKAFTKKLLVNNLGIDAAQASEVLKILEKYEMVRKKEIEIDDDIQEIYEFLPTASFVAMLIFVREVIQQPHNFSYWSQYRRQPYLK